MAAKIKCPGCGAKNDAAAHRCRICTAVINPGAERPAAAEEPAAPVGIDHFDSGDIARQIRPARERFSSAGSGLSARIAAAGESPTGAPVSDSPAEQAPVEYIEHHDEPFDPDALFRDMS